MVAYLGTNWSDSSWSCCSSTLTCRAASTPSISSTLEPWPRPMTSPTPQSRSQRYVQTAADPDLTFHFNAYPEPDRASHLRDANLRPLGYRPSRAPFGPGSELFAYFISKNNHFLSEWDCSVFEKSFTAKRSQKTS
jgi:hypothetical protein